jgi:UDP-GlcNAc:undecaprenyl-phosphate/decaprenyl-phosphate GlcNAc-1-phosphate transferase
MKEYGLTALVAAAVTYLLIPLVRRFAIAVGAMKQPRERDVHTEPVPTLGGLAIYGGLAAGLLVASRMYPLSTVFRGTRVGSGLLLAGAVVVVMGFVDDRWGLGALTKLAGQVAAAVILVWSGAMVPWLPLPGGGTLVLTPDEQTALTILVVVVTINAVNFIDGLDGLAAGIVAIGAAAFYLYYYTLAKRLGLGEQDDPALAAAVLGGMCVGFLPHNFHPARIFMGDTGSMLLGLLLAYAPISSLATLDPNTLTAPAAYRGGTVNRFPEVLPLLVPAAIMLLPYADLLLAVVRRTRAGMSPFAADKKHLQHRLLDIGHSHRASVLIMYMWATLFAGTVVLLSIMRTKLYVLGIVTVGGVLVLLLLSMPRLRWWARPRPGRKSGVPAGAAPGPGPALADAVAVGSVPAGVGAAGPGYLTPGGPPAPVRAARPPWEESLAVPPLHRPSDQQHSLDPHQAPPSRTAEPGSPGAGNGYRPGHGSRPGRGPLPGSAGQPTDGRPEDEAPPWYSGRPDTR